MQQIARNKTRRVSDGEEEASEYGVNTGLEQFLNLNASEAYKRPWHRLERGLRLNRLRKFIDTEKERMSLSSSDTDTLTNLLHKALDKKQLNSKTCVVYNMENQEIQEIKGLMYHKVADGRIISQIVEKKAGVTFRKGGSQKKVVKVVAGAAGAAAAALAETVTPA
jgi:hypothetical protein